MSARARYATRIMVCIAHNQAAGPVRKNMIAAEEGLSPDYVEQILVSLKNAALVNSHRGAKGGFTTARDPSAITVADILQALEGPLDLAPCETGSGACSRANDCVTSRIWAETGRLLVKHLSSVRLGDLLAEVAQRERKGTKMYHI
ncbi:MAG: Rrf2 family transcriptional regulator [Kiritimatiellae bacterium]|nr:Rrf2 family transcriptional regulator [Kiritimatiellia bacterium]